MQYESMLKLWKRIFKEGETSRTLAEYRIKVKNMQREGDMRQCMQVKTDLYNRHCGSRAKES